MLDNLSGKFSHMLKYLRGEAKITEENMRVALREIKLSLLEADVNFKVVKRFIEGIREKALGEAVQQALTPYQQIVKIVRQELEGLLGGESRDLNPSTTRPAVIMLVGLQGTGKTTTAGKLAHHLQALGKTVLLCSLDLKRLAAAEQLEIIATEVKAQIFQHSGGPLNRIVRDLLARGREYGYDYIIADTAGRLHVDDDLMSELQHVKDALHPTEVMFVADALTGQDAVNSALAFSQNIGIDSIALTKLDADSRGGAALSMVSVTGKPIKFIGVGEKPGDFQKFHPERLASKILGMGDMLTFIEKAEKEFDEKEAEKVAQKLLRDEFSLEDFAGQLRQIEKLGSMKDIMGMLPHPISPLAGRQNPDQMEVDEDKVRHMVAIINSMTREERVKPKVINGRRRLRIARGSGRPVQEVNQLLKQFLELRKTMKKPFFRKMLKKFDFFGKMM